MLKKIGVEGKLGVAKHFKSNHTTYIVILSDSSHFYGFSPEWAFLWLLKCIPCSVPWCPTKVILSMSQTMYGPINISKTVPYIF